MSHSELELYGGKYKLSFNEASHRYKVNGEYKTGVTTMLSVLGKENLIQWAANMAAEAAYKLAQKGVPMYEAIKEAKYAHTRKRDKSADTGKAVHQWIEHHLQGKTLRITPDMQPSVSAFLEWEQANNVRYLHSEKVLYSEQYDYCGTADVIFELNGTTYMADFKTSDCDREFKTSQGYTGKVRARKEHLLQCALYDQAYSEEFGKGCDAYMVIYVTKQGNLHTFATSKTEELKEAALCVARTYQLTRQIEKDNQYREESNVN